MSGSGTGPAVPSRTLSVIREACVLPPEQRTTEQIDVILSFVQDVAFFAELPKPQQRHLCKVMSLETFPSRSKIFNMGDHGDKYYIILTGAVSVQTLVPKSYDDDAEPIMEMDIVAQLKEGHGFGELALQDTTLRQATVTTTNFTEFLITTRDNYQQFASAEHRKFVAARCHFLRQCPPMLRAIKSSEASEQEVKVMAQCLREKSLRGHDLLCKQGDPVEFMVLVRSGFLMKLRAVEVDRDDKEPSFSGSKQPSRSSRSRSSHVALASHSRASDGSGSKSSSRAPPSSKLLHYGSLPAFSLYGCWEIAGDESTDATAATGIWPFSLVAESTAEVYVIQKQDMLRTIAKKLLAALVEISEEMHYSDSWLLQMNRQTERWDAYKHDMALKVNVDRLDVEERLGLKESAFKVTNVVLTQREEEFYSDLPSHHLRRWKQMRKDKDLQKMLHRAGVPGYANATLANTGATYLTLGDFSTKMYATPREDWDPSIFFVKHWSAVSKDKASSLAVDLSEIAGFSPASSPRSGAPSPTLLSARRRSTVITMEPPSPRNVPKIGLTAPRPPKPKPPRRRAAPTPPPRRKVWVPRSKSPLPPWLLESDLSSQIQVKPRHVEPLMLR